MEEKRFLEEDFSDFLAELVEGERLNESNEKRKYQLFLCTS